MREGKLCLVLFWGKLGNVPRASNDDNSSATVHNMNNSSNAADDVKSMASSWDRTREQREESDSDDRDGSVTIGDVQGEEKDQCHVRSQSLVIQRMLIELSTRNFE